MKYRAPRLILGAICTIGAGICLCFTIAKIMEISARGSQWFPPIPYAAEATVVTYHRERDRCYPIVRYVDANGQTNVEELWSWSAEPRYSNGTALRIHYLPGGLPGGKSRGHYPDLIRFTSIHAISWALAISPFLIVPLAFCAYCLLNGVAPLRVIWKTAHETKT